jgi:hypothetical protein
MPRQAYVWRLLKPGFAPASFIGEPPGVPPPGFDSLPYPTFKLRSERSVPLRWLSSRAEGSASRTLLNKPAAQVDDVLIDRHEVTNEEYKKFVDAGGTTGASSGSSPS